MQACLSDLKWPRIAAAILIVLFASGAAIAQETTGTLRGVVNDSQGLAVPGVTVTANGPQGTRAATTDAAGRFSIPFLTPAEYDVRAELQGFKAFEQKRVNVGLGQTIDVPM